MLTISSLCQRVVAILKTIFALFLRAQTAASPVIQTVLSKAKRLVESVRNK